MSQLLKLPDVNVLVLAAGKVPRQNDEAGYPACLIEVEGSSVLERIVENTKHIENAQFACVFLNSEAQRYHLDRIAKLLMPGARCVLVPEQTQGSACTALLAACQLDGAAELLIVSANELVDMNFSDVMSSFRSRKLDAGTLVFKSVQPRYSYVALDAHGLVVEVAQREPISSNATAGVFWFARTNDFVESAKEMIRKDAHVDSLYFVAPTFNELVLRQMRIGVVSLDLDKYIPLKTERQIQHYEST
jgi:choline kinase